MRFRESIAQEIVKQVAEGLQYLHEERHVIHRDIKPSNILLNWKMKNLSSLLTQDDYSKALHLQPDVIEVKIGDFGFAQTLSVSD